VPVRTLKSWLARPDFRDRYRRERLAVLERTTGRLVEATTQAVGVLVAALDSERTPDRLRAAQIILTFAHKGVEVADLNAELERGTPHRVVEWGGGGPEPEPEPEPPPERQEPAPALPVPDPPPPPAAVANVFDLECAADHPPPRRPGTFPEIWHFPWW